MKNKFNIKGVNHIYGDNIKKINRVLYFFRKIMHTYNYKEIKIPVIEKKILFNHILEQNSEILEKETFSFIDKNKDTISLIPEGTSGCLNALVKNKIIRNNKKIKLWYISPIFRRENVQFARKRLFYQIGIESYGYKNFFIEFEHIIIIYNLFNLLKIKNTTLEINCLGSIKTIKIFNNILYLYFLKNKIFKNVKKFKITNMIRILDKIKNQNFKNFPNIINYISIKLKCKFLYLVYNIKKLGINIKINKYLVRGLNYYNNIIYEWKTIMKNKKFAICSGGRYNHLSKKISNINCYSTGCAIGLDRLIYNINIKNKDNIIGIIKYNKKIPLYINYIISNKIKKILSNNIIINEYSYINLKKKVHKNIYKFIIYIKDKSFNNDVINIYTKNTNKDIKLQNIKKYI